MTRPWSPVWLFVGDFSGQNRGKRVKFAGEALAKVMAQVAPLVTLELPAALRGPAEGSLAIALGRPRDLSAAWLERNVAPLRELMAIVDELRAGTLNAGRVVPRLRTLLGDAPLVMAVEEILGVMPSSGDERTSKTAADMVGQQASESGVEALFARTAGVAAAADPQASPLDQLLRELVRGSLRGAPDSASQRVATLLEGIVREVVAEFWQNPRLREVVANWKGLRLVLGESTASHPISLEILDVQGDPQVALAAVLQVADERPDCVFVATPIAVQDEAEAWCKLAAIASESRVPIVCTALLDGLWCERQSGGDANAWAKVRSVPGGHWLACVVNEIALSEASEYHGETRAVVWGSGVYGLAARMTASFAASSGFALVGDLGLGVQAPASHPAINEPDIAVATRLRARIGDLERAHQEGLIALGEGRYPSQLHVVTATTLAHGAEDLPTTLLLGRSQRVLAKAREGWPIDGSDDRLALVLHRALESQIFCTGGVRITTEARRDLEPPVMRIEIDAAPPWLARPKHLVCEVELVAR